MKRLGLLYTMALLSLFALGGCYWSVSGDVRQTVPYYYYYESPQYEHIYYYYYYPARPYYYHRHRHWHHR